MPTQSVVHYDSCQAGPATLLPSKTKRK